AEWFSKQQYEGISKNGNISLMARKERVETDSIEANLTTTTEKTKQTNNNNERDIFFGEEEYGILTAKPLDSEPDRARVKWRVFSNG
ncbi:MAG: hypothetical protein ACPLVJ_01700, partial [Candidatus Bathyarchaeales archaeon]